MTTKNMCRCKDCAYLIEGANGEWCCDDCIDRFGNAIKRNIEDIPDNECSLNQEW